MRDATGQKGFQEEVYMDLFARSEGVEKNSCWLMVNEGILDRSESKHFSSCDVLGYATDPS